MSLSHTYGRMDKEVYEFCEVFSQSSEDLADAAEIFLKNLQGLWVDSTRRAFRLSAENPQGILVYYDTIIAQIS